VYFPYIGNYVPIDGHKLFVKFILL